MSENGESDGAHRHFHIFWNLQTTTRKIWKRFGDPDVPPQDFFPPEGLHALSQSLERRVERIRPRRNNTREQQERARRVNAPRSSAHS